MLPRSFYARPTIVVARALLGKVLARDTSDGLRTARIVETEAYLADDPASHAFRGMTPRNVPMFGAPGHAYVYVSYGVHQCMNVIAKAPGVRAGGVLLRGAEPLAGFPPHQPPMRGPGLIGRAFRLTTSHSGLDLVTSELTIRDAPPVPAEAVGRSPRIGLSAGATTGKPWRFYIRGAPGVSRAPRR